MEHNTSMIQYSGTQTSVSCSMQSVKMVGGGEPQPTSHVFQDAQLVPVRISGTQQVILKVNTSRLNEQESIERENDSIRRRVRG